jgi:hypothetical protein
MTDANKIMPVEPCGLVNKCMASPSSYASSMGSYGAKSPTLVADKALRELEAARAKDVAAHERNLPALEHNKAIAARIEAVMTEAGIPRSYSERDTNSRARYPKTITHQAGWIGDVARNCKTDDGFAHATSSYERLKKDYTAYAERAKVEADHAAQHAQRERDAELAKRKADMELAGMLLRYELPIESDWGDVLEHLRSKDQRLDLAVAMEQTRGDWSEGPDRVSDALDRFQINTTEDKDIANDVLSCLHDFNDGRVFRDTTWSYSALYASITNTALLADCQKAMANAGSYS